MNLKEGGKILEVRVLDEELSDVFLQQGAKPGIFPEKVIVKRRNKNGGTDTVEYFRENHTIGGAA